MPADAQISNMLNYQEILDHPKSIPPSKIRTIDKFRHAGSESFYTTAGQEMDLTLQTNPRKYGRFPLCGIQSNKSVKVFTY